MTPWPPRPGEDRDGWSGAARSARLLELLEARERLEAEILRCTGEWDAAGAWAEDGAVNPQAWLVHRGRVTRADAVRLVRGARLARRHERTGKALAAGDVSAAHVDLIASAVRHRERCYEERGEALLDAARALPPETFRRAARCWRSLADDAAATPRRTRPSISGASTARRLSGGGSCSTASSTPRPVPPCRRRCAPTTKGQAPPRPTGGV